MQVAQPELADSEYSGCTAQEVPGGKLEPNHTQEGRRTRASFGR